MGLPGSVDIGGINYKITVQDDVKVDGEDAYGVTNYLDYSIKINSIVPEIGTKQTLIHEILHILIYESGLPRKYQSHKLINPLAHMLFRYLRENDISWIKDEVKPDDK